MPEDRFLHPKAGHSQKVTMLTDLEFRVWTQYLLSADDFGVMRANPAKLKADNEHIDNRPVKLIQRCLDALVNCGLLHTFAHQGKTFVYQHDWQKWQKVEYPRSTNLPKPDADALDRCDEATLALFEKHPGGTRKHKFRDARSEGVPNVSREHAEDVPTTRAGAPAKRLTANGIRLMANGLEGGAGEPFDGQAAFRRLCEDYPRNRVATGQRVQSAFIGALGDDPVSWPARFHDMLGNLANHNASHEWRMNPKYIPGLERWLSEGLWERVLSADPPPAEQLTKGSNVTMNAAANILKESA